MESLEIVHLAEEVDRLISRAFIHLDESDRQLMRHFGLTVTQYWALVHLEHEEGRSLSELANLLLCDKSNVTSVVDRLEELELAERRRGKAGDRRYTRVVLTEEGRRLRDCMVSAREHLITMRLQGLSPAVLHHLRSSLQQLGDLLQAQFDDGEVADLIENSIELGKCQV